MKNIKNYLLLVVFTLFATQLTAQTTENRSIGAFKGVKAVQGIDVYLHKGSSPGLKVEAKGMDLDEVITEVEGGVLKISLKRGSYRNIDVKVDVTYSGNLNMLAASSAASIYSEETIESSSMEIMVSSAANIETALSVGELKVDVSSAGDLELSGKAKSIRVEVSSAGEIDAFDLTADNVYVRASSAGDAKVHAVNEIDARASSGGSIKYRGSPAKSSTDSSSGGSVRKTE